MITIILVIILQIVFLKIIIQSTEELSIQLMMIHQSQLTLQIVNL